MASSRVGTSTSACGESPPGTIRCRSGSANAAVLPVPVAAWPTTSEFLSRAGIASRWIGVGSSYPSSSSVACSSGRRSSSAKVVTRSFFLVARGLRRWPASWSLGGSGAGVRVFPRRLSASFLGDVARDRRRPAPGPRSKATVGSERRGKARGKATVPERQRLQIAPSFLFLFDGFEEGLEVALAEAEGAVPLDELEEQGGAVADRLGEDLQQVTVLVPVDQDGPLLQLLDRHPHLADARPELRVVVVGVRRLQELDAARTHLVHRAQDVVRGERDVLEAGPAAELEVLVDLRLPLAQRRLVQRKLDAVVAVGDNLRHQGRVVSRDVVADELGHVHEAHDPVVE